MPGSRVLFVAPEAPERELYVKGLQEAGFATAVASSPALATLLSQTDGPFDVIVTELAPKSRDAWAFIADHCGKPASAPVIILTSLVRPDRANQERAESLGCAAFVAKPCSVLQLVDVVTFVSRGGRGLEVLAYVEPRAVRTIP